MVPVRPRVRIHLHGPEFVTVEFAPLVADAPLAEEYRPPRAADHRQRHTQAENEPTWSRSHDERQIEQPLPSWKPRRWFTRYATLANVPSSHNSVPQNHPVTLIQYLRALIIRQKPKTATPLNTECASV
jgi:hypothetical protein